MTAAPAAKCPVCGCPLEADGVCLACFFAEAEAVPLDADTAKSRGALPHFAALGRLELPCEFARHRLLRELGRGGSKGAVGEKYVDAAVSALHGKIPTYAAFPNLVWQAESWSDIAGRSYSNYGPDGRQRIWIEAVEPLAAGTDG